MQLLYYTIHVIGFAQALFLAMVLFIKKENRYANRIFSIVFFVVSGMFLESILINLNVHRGFPFFPWNTFLFPYIFGPVLFLYASMLTGRMKKIKYIHIIHFIPAVIIALINLYLYYSQDISIRLQSLSDFPNEAITISPIMTYFGRTYEFIYYFSSLFILYSFRKRIKDFFSDISKITLNWLHFIIFAFIIIEATIGILQIIPTKPLVWISSLIAVIMMFVSALLVILQPDLLNDNTNINFGRTPKYVKLRMDESKEKSILNDLLQLMSDKKPYLTETLNLDELAGMMSIDPNRLSMILNIHLKENFYTFINKYRIEEVKKNLRDPKYKNENILTAAYDSGFNSKSSFNDAFKKLTGVTPKEYRKKIQKNTSA